MKMNGKTLTEQVSEAGHGPLKRTSDIDLACKKRLEERWGIKTVSYTQRRDDLYKKYLDNQMIEGREEVIKERRKRRAKKK